MRLASESKPQLAIPTNARRRRRRGRSRARGRWRSAPPRRAGVARDPERAGEVVAATAREDRQQAAVSASRAGRRRPRRRGRRRRARPPPRRPRPRRAASSRACSRSRVCSRRTRSPALAQRPLGGGKRAQRAAAAGGRVDDQDDVALHSAERLPTAAAEAVRRERPSASRQMRDGGPGRSLCFAAVCAATAVLLAASWRARARPADGLRQLVDDGGATQAQTTTTASSGPARRSTQPAPKGPAAPQNADLAASTRARRGRRPS